MKIKNTIFFVLYCCISQAQIAGYMGKRLSIGYSNYFFPSLINPNANAMDGFGFNSTHCGNIEYTIKNNINFCAGVQFSKTGIKNDNGYTYRYTPAFSSSQSSTTALYTPSNKKPMQLKSTNISFGFKFFRSGLIAPVGKYVKLDFILLLHNVSYDKNAFYYDDYYSSSYVKKQATIGKGEYQFKSFAIGYTIGKNRILFDKLILDTGIRFGVSPNGVINSVFGDFSSYSSGSEADFEHGLKVSTTTRILWSQLVNFHIGIGFLAF